MQTFRPLCTTTHCRSLTNSKCKRASSCSYSFRFSLPLPSGSSFSASIIGSSFAQLAHSLVPTNRPKSVLLPGEKEADVAGHAPWILEHFRLEVEAKRPELIVPEFVSRLGSALQGHLPVGLRIVDSSPAVAAKYIRETVDLHFGLSALGRMGDQLHHYLHQLLSRFLRWFVKLLHHRLLLFFLLLHIANFFGGLRYLVLGHSVLDISRRKNAGLCRLHRAAVFRHGFSLPAYSGPHQRPSIASDHQVLIGLYNVGGDLAVRRADTLLMFPVSRFVQLQPQPGAGPADARFAPVP